MLNKWIDGCIDGQRGRRGLGLYNQRKGIRKLQPRKPDKPGQRGRNAPSMTWDTRAGTAGPSTTA